MKVVLVKIHSSLMIWDSVKLKMCSFFKNIPNISYRSKDLKVKLSHVFFWPDCKYDFSYLGRIGDENNSLWPSQILLDYKSKLEIKGRIMILTVLIKNLEMSAGDCKSHWIQKLAFLFWVEEKDVIVGKNSINSFPYLFNNFYVLIMLCWAECYMLGIYSGISLEEFMPPWNMECSYGHRKNKWSET